MEEINWISYLMLFLAGAANGIMDLLQFHYLSSIFSTFKKQKFWNPQLSWENKWIWTYENSRGWPTPVKKEKFWGSSRWFVFITDGWHLVQFFTIKFLFLAVMFHSEFMLWDIPGVCMYYVGFWITYESKLLRKKNGRS